MKKIILIMLAAFCVISIGIGVVAIHQSQSTGNTTTALAYRHARTRRKTKPTRHIIIMIAGHRLRAHLYHNHAANELWRKLPLTLKFGNMGPGYVEKISNLSHPLSTKNMTKGGNPRPGEIAYWSPQPRIVFYWGNVGYWDGIHRIGHFDTPGSTRIIHQHQHFTATIRQKK